MSQFGGIAQKSSSFLMPNYGARNVAIVRGCGSYVWDAEGRRYLDFLAGISVNNLGHCHPKVTAAIQKQASELVHCSNLYYIPVQAELASLLCGACFADRCFFANSGAEVNEGAIKLARLYSKKKFGDNRFEIITFRNSFHGRTLATLTATGQEKVQKGFEPLVDGFRYAAFNDIESVLNLITDQTCAIMLEPVQGEGGVVAAEPEFLKALREECDQKNLLLIFDEIQCGMFRCGSFFAHQLANVEPDIMTLAKALGNGVPIGALLARESIGAVLEPGTHGSTFGGNPLACSAAVATVNELVSGIYSEKVVQLGAHFESELKHRLMELPSVAAIRVYGLMVGIELRFPGADVVKQCMEGGILINCTMGNILRLLPPFTVTPEECTYVADVLRDIISSTAEKLKAEQPAAPKGAVTMNGVA